MVLKTRAWLNEKWKKRVRACTAHTEYLAPAPRAGYTVNRRQSVTVSPNRIHIDNTLPHNNYKLTFVQARLNRIFIPATKIAESKKKYFFPGMCIYFMLLIAIRQKFSVPIKTAIKRKQKAPLASSLPSFCNRSWQHQVTLELLWHGCQCPAMMLTRFGLGSVPRVRDLLCHVKVRYGRIGRKRMAVGASCAVTIYTPSTGTGFFPGLACRHSHSHIAGRCSFRLKRCRNVQWAIGDESRSSLESLGMNINHGLPHSCFSIVISMGYSAIRLHSGDAVRSQTCLDAIEHANMLRGTKYSRISFP